MLSERDLRAIEEYARKQPGPATFYWDLVEEVRRLRQVSLKVVEDWVEYEEDRVAVRKEILGEEA